MEIRFYPALGQKAKFATDQQVLETLQAEAALSETLRGDIVTRATNLVTRLRSESQPTLMEHFLAEYGLSTREGVALMCLAEAMLRVPDGPTIDALIEDKIVPSEWNRHLGAAASSLVNASTWALMLTGRVLDDTQPGVAGTIRGLIRRMGEPVIRAAVKQAMREMGRQFVLGQTIDKALENGARNVSKGYTYSFDMLGEAAVTKEDAARYAADYAHAIARIANSAKGQSIADSPGISIKLSALHPRFEPLQKKRVLAELVPIVRDLARAAKNANIALHVDAEEQDRLVLTFQVIEAVMQDPDLHGWDGFGLVIQAYGKRASAAIDTFYQLAVKYDRRVNVRLVKGAYWDTEIKHAQVEGMPGFPVYSTKQASDVSYICLAQKLFGLNDRIFPQFATHNAHSVAAVLELAKGREFEFQRLHGMGERLHEIVKKEHGTRCRIYAPVGRHRDLLAYLVRRLLENGANSSFVNQIVDTSVPAEEVAADPFEALRDAKPPALLRAPSEIFAPQRCNSSGWDITDEAVTDQIAAVREEKLPQVHPLTVSDWNGSEQRVTNPSTGESITSVIEADSATARQAIRDARPWDASAAERARVLQQAADLYERDAEKLFGVLGQEAGKTLADGVGEIREAVDFLRYYAAEGLEIDRPARGIITAISPWNFPLAIFTGQIAAALMAGNAVLCKPAEQTPVIAFRAVQLLHEAGVPKAALQLLTGTGPEIGQVLTSDAAISGVVFTGSTDTAQIISRNIAKSLAPGTPLIAETGGLNAMIVDSTALLEQATLDIVASAFQSAGQRCSALRCLYVQEDVADNLIEMIKGAMNVLQVGPALDLDTDVGPVIDQEAQQGIVRYLAEKKAAILHQIPAPETGFFVPPTLIEVDGIADIEKEIFGPVLHVARFAADALSKVVEDINTRGFGLTFGMHSRIDQRVQDVAESVLAGNIYINRNQIGAVVGSQPFGGEGLSGTGPKAGGPNYLPRFLSPLSPQFPVAQTALPAGSQTQEQDTLPVMQNIMAGPTGELNRLALYPRAPVLCLGPGAENIAAQQAAVVALGGQTLIAVDERDPIPILRHAHISGVLWWGDTDAGREIAVTLSERQGPLVPLIAQYPDAAHVLHERHLCVDTTAAGGNAALLAGEG